jgi:hypothetical protein
MLADRCEVRVDELHDRAFRIEELEHCADLDEVRVQKCVPGPRPPCKHSCDEAHRMRDSPLLPSGAQAGNGEEPRRTTGDGHVSPPSEPRRAGAVDAHEAENMLGRGVTNQVDQKPVHSARDLLEGIELVDDEMLPERLASDRRRRGLVGRSTDRWVALGQWGKYRPGRG